MIGLFVGSILDEILLLFSSLLFSFHLPSLLQFGDSFSSLMYMIPSSHCFCFYHLERVSFSILFLTSFVSLLFSTSTQHFIRQEIEENIIAWGVF